MNQSLLSATAVIALALASAPADAQGYQFRNVVDSSGTFRGFSFAPGINDAGSVAFAAALETDDGFDNGIFRVDADGTFTTLASSADFPEFGIPSNDATYVPINNNGTALFIRLFRDPSTTAYTRFGFFTANDSGVTTVVDPDGPLRGGVYEFNGFNDSGTVVFAARNADTEFEGLYQYTSDGVTTEFFGTKDPNYQAASPAASINNLGTAVYPFLDVDGNYNLGKREAGGVDTVLLEGGSGSEERFQYPLINDSGTVAFLQGGSIFTVQDGDDVVDVLEGSMLDVFAGREFGFNNLGELAFLAFESDDVFGIYNGGNPETDRVIRRGDELFGSTVISLNVSRDSINASGDIVFYYSLSDGRTGIAVASVVPEPSAAALAGFAGLGLLARRRRA